LGRGNGSEAFILCLLAGLAPFGLVLQAFVVKKDLFAGCPGKLLAAIYARYWAILIVRHQFGVDMFCVSL